MKLGDATISIFISELGKYRVNINHASLCGGSIVWHTWSEMFEVSIETESPEESLKELLRMVEEKFPL